MGMSDFCGFFHICFFFLLFWSDAKVHKSCRSSEPNLKIYLLGNTGFGTAGNDPSKVIFLYFDIPHISNLLSNLVINMITLFPAHSFKQQDNQRTRCYTSNVCSMLMQGCIHEACCYTSNVSTKLII